MADDTSIAARLRRVETAVRAAETRYGREPGSVRLLAVSKTKPVSMLVEAINAGQHAFGENYMQEAQPKIEALSERKIEWHFIGPVQSNKTRTIARLFDWAQSVDRLSIATRLSRQRSEEMPALNICLQVNIGAETSKVGVAPEAVAELLSSVAALPRLKVRGLMTIPAPTAGFARQRRAFAQMRCVFDAQAAKYGLDTLSMGMSDDFEAAIAEGATMIRLGTALFGARK